MNINPEVSEKRFKETLISLNLNNRKRSGFKVDQLECNHSSLFNESKNIIPAQNRSLENWIIRIKNR